MAQDDFGPSLPEKYRSLSIDWLSQRTKGKLALMLDIEGTPVVIGDKDFLDSYNGLGELARLSFQQLREIKKEKSPTRALLRTWRGPDATICSLWHYLYLLERLDVLKACKADIYQDCEAVLEENVQESEPNTQHPEMMVDETKHATIDDVRSGQKTYYQAFVCYSQTDPRDREFVREAIAYLETERGLKMFVPGRNDIPGSAEHSLNAYVIEERCKKIIIVISRSFLCSTTCEFQLKFAQALAPGPRYHRLIPVIREPGTKLPRILEHLSVCDFSKTEIAEWIWTRLYNAVSRTGPEVYIGDQFTTSTESLKEITLPRYERLGD